MLAICREDTHSNAVHCGVSVEGFGELGTHICVCRAHSRIIKNIFITQRQKQESEYFSINFC
jgi:hypothetical protein